MTARPAAGGAQERALVLRRLPLERILAGDGVALALEPRHHLLAPELHRALVARVDLVELVVVVDDPRAARDERLGLALPALVAFPRGHAPGGATDEPVQDRV